MWLTYLVALLVLQTTVWPFLAFGVPRPNLFLNALFLLALFSKKPSLLPQLISALFISVLSPLSFGYFIIPIFLFYNLTQFIRSQTFIFSEKTLLWVLLLSHLVFSLTQEIFFSAWSGKSFYFNIIDFAISVAFSALAFPIQRWFFKAYLGWWRNTKWGELGYE